MGMQYARTGGPGRGEAYAEFQDSGQAIDAGGNAPGRRAAICHLTSDICQGTPGKLSTRSIFKSGKLSTN